MLVLDTDHLSVLEWEASATTQRLLERLSGIAPDEAATTIINFEEQMRGWLAYLSRARTLTQQVEAYRRLKRHLDNYRTIMVLDFNLRAATEFQRLRKRHRTLGTMDLKIASIVLANDATLLSRNLTDFSKIADLKVEDWTAE
ncbi:MAG: type II toxin-antitoxin system VapC family toxin [Deltaproteobacteria bacterium]|nr:type II toxin-antitoxin system VapC family toxin [Deltaproteobacteria bacterium]